MLSRNTHPLWQSSNAGCTEPAMAWLCVGNPHRFDCRSDFGAYPVVATQTGFLAGVGSGAYCLVNAKRVGENSSSLTECVGVTTGGIGSNSLCGALP